jgi:hypothetical protein
MRRGGVSQPLETVFDAQLFAFEFGEVEGVETGMLELFLNFGLKPVMFFLQLGDMRLYLHRAPPAQ